MVDSRQHLARYLYSFVVVGMTDAERRERKRISRQNSRKRKNGMAIPFTRAGRPPEYRPRCPVCGCEISVMKDCRCL